MDQVMIPWTQEVAAHMFYVDKLFWVFQEIIRNIGNVAIPSKRLTVKNLI